MLTHSTTDESTMDVTSNEDSFVVPPLGRTCPPEGGTTNARPLPAGWRWVRLGEICTTTSGGTPDRGVSTYYGGDISWVKSGELRDGVIASTEETITEEGVAHSSAKIFPAGTLLIALYGATVGKLGVLQISAATNQAVCAIFTSENIDRSFLFFFLLYHRQFLIQASFGGAQPNISQDIVRNIAIPLPPLAEQRAIVRQLERELADVTRLRAAARQQAAAIALLTSAYLREVFAGNAAQGWPRGRLGEVLRLRKEVIHPHNQPSGPATFVGLEHIESHTGRRIGSLDVEMSTLTGRKPQFFAGDIVYGYLRPYLNKVWLAEFDGLCSVDQYVYSVNADRADARYVAAFMRSPLYLSRAPISTTPGQLPRIRTEEVASVELPLPPLDEQRTIVQHLDGRMAEVALLQRHAAEQRRSIEALPGALLRGVFGG